MRFLFKTDYDQDIRLAKHGGHVFWYSLLGLALAASAGRPDMSNQVMRSRAQWLLGMADDLF